MAIVQVSRITNRKGLSENLPQLAGAELGWATDTRQLYIGNGTLQEGAPVIGNTEILTEFSDILLVGGAYTYKGAAAGYTVQTGATSGSPVTLNLQQWLDQFASVLDFGAVGDGVTDDTDAINRALYQLYCRDPNPQIRRSLFFPAGRYLITESIIIPPYAMLCGEGINSSVIVLDTSSPTSALSDYVARFGDSLQQTGVNIGNNGATPPQDITISNMGFESLELTDIFLVEDAGQCTFVDVSFQGPLVPLDLTNASSNTAGVRFNSTLSLVCNNITFRRCLFSGTTWALSTPNQVSGCLITESTFDTLYQGILLGDPTPVNGGPTGFRILGNVFDNIYAEGINIASNTELNASGYNMFYDVGNHFGGSTAPATAVINFAGQNNVSVGDLFQRTTAYSQTYPRININFGTNIAFDGSDRVQQGVYSRQTGVSGTLNNNVVNQTILTFDATATRAVQINYTIVRDTSTRTGVYTIVAGTDASGTGIQGSDSGVQNASTGVTFSVSETASTVSWRATTTNTGIAATINYSITRLA
jgi:Pectate lyase superfamily protein